MKNLPEKIYLDLGFTPDQSDDFNDLGEVTWSQNNATGSGIEFIRKDIAEKMAKEFAEYLRYNTKNMGGGMYRRNKKYLTQQDDIFSLDELFTEFKQQNK